MKHKESDLQIRCIKWFRYQHPAYARLLYHPKNEGNGNRRQGAVAKAEGVQPGVADLILPVPAFDTISMDSHGSPTKAYHSLAIEMKTKTGRQSPEQRQWQRLFEAAGGRYIIVRSYEEFILNVALYIDGVPTAVHEAVKETHADIQREADDKAKDQFNKIIGKK